MSERGWQEFQAARPADWVVLHGGAVAAYATGSLAESTALASSFAAVEGLERSGAILTCTATTVTVRLTRDLWLLEEDHVALAHRVSAVAQQHGASPTRAVVQEVQIAVSALPDSIDLAFWRAVLGYGPAADDNAVDPLGHGSSVWMQELDPGKPLRHAMHLDVSLPREQAQRRLEAALAAGGRIVNDVDAPATWILADRAGNRVCLASWPDGAVPASGGADG